MSMATERPTRSRTGALVAAYLFGIRGESLIAGRVSLDGTRTTAAQIEAYLAPLTESVLDVDGNGTANVFTDGALIISYLSGFRGRSLIAGRVSSNGTRTTVEAIEAYLQSIEHPPHHAIFTRTSGTGQHPQYFETDCYLNHRPPVLLKK